jgi:hypothetical protein
MTRVAIVGTGFGRWPRQGASTARRLNREGSVSG